jgi:hypothetical protein
MKLFLALFVLTAALYFTDILPLVFASLFGSSFQSHAISQRSFIGLKCAVTGTSRGFGRAIVKELSRLGCTVACMQREADRNTSVCQTFIPLELNRANSVREASKLLVAFKPDVFITNAAVVTSQGKLNEDGVDEMFAVNYLGHFALYKSLLSANSEPNITSTSGYTCCAVISVCACVVTMQFLSEVNRIKSRLRLIRSHLANLPITD